MNKIVVELTENEKLALHYTLNGFKVDDIADALSIPGWTVDEYIHNARLKLSAKNKVQAVARAVQLGILPLKETTTV